MSRTIDTPVINTVHFCISIKGHNFVKKSFRVMVLGQIVALVMVNKQMKFHQNCFNTYKVIAEVKVCQDNDDNDNDYAAANADDDTRVMTIPRRLFFFENTAELKITPFCNVMSTLQKWAIFIMGVYGKISHILLDPTNILFPVI